MKITLLRHAPPVTLGLCYGRTDVQVQEVPERTLTHLCLRWEVAGFPRILSSPSPRCHNLAKSIAKHGRKQRTVEIDPRLLEYDFGEWENRYWADLPREQTDAWTERWWELSPPHGESFSALCTRVEAFMEDLRKNGQDAWIVGHAGSLRVLQGMVQKIPMPQIMNLTIPHLEPFVLEIH